MKHLRSNAYLKVIIAFIVIMTVTISVCAKLKDKEPQNIKIGVIYPLTGDASFWGENAKNAVILAKKTFVGSNYLKDKGIQLIIEDSKSNTKDAISAANKLIYQDKVQFIVGDLVSSNLLAIAPLSEKNKILTIGQGSNPKIKYAGDYIFRTWPSDDIQGSVIAKFLNKGLKVNNCSLFYIANEYGMGVVEEVKKRYTGTIVVEESFNPKQKSYRDIIQKILGQNSEAIVIVSNPEQLPIILKQLNEAKVQVPIVGTETFNNSDIIAMSLDFPIYFSYPKFASAENITYATFRDNFMKTFNKAPGTPADAVFDAATLLLKGIDKFGYSSTKVKDFLYAIKDYEGVSGSIKFDKNGDVLKPFVIKKIESGNVSEVWMAK